MELLLNISIIYSIKTLYCIPKRYSALFYIYFLSPCILYNALFNTNIVSQRYVKFLRLLCYPEAKYNIKYNGSCKGYHQLQKKCYDKDEILQMLLKVFNLYVKYYGIHSIYLLMFKKYSLLKTCNLECRNILQSTSFLFLQNLFQRIALCNTYDLRVMDTLLVTSLCSYPIVFENISRVSQINTMMLSNILIGGINKFYKTQKPQLTTILLLLTFLKTKHINKATLCLSIANALTECKINFKLDEDCPMMSIPWHPFI